MYKVLEKFLRILHPFMPFITEEIWQQLPHQGESIMVQPWPHIQQNLIDKKTDLRMSALFEVINTLRNMRLELEVGLNERIDVKVFSASKETLKLLNTAQGYIKNLVKTGSLNFFEHYARSESEFVWIVKDMHIVIPLAASDIEKHKAKIEERIKKTKAAINSKEKTLANDAFIKKAPAEIVAGEKEKLKDLGETLKKLEALNYGLR
jgi:valyl-tRNA synthetase